MSKGGRWSPWARVEPAVRIDGPSLAETLDGGQSFRWSEIEPGIWQGAWGECLARIRIGESDTIELSAPEGTARRCAKDAARYFCAETDFTRLADTLPWRSDPRLEAAMRRLPGLRMLRQPFEETLLAFLCSPQKRIPQIKIACERLADRFGERIACGVRALPSWSRLASAEESELRACGIGYRARHIHNAARWLADRPGFLEEAESHPYPDARKRLLQVPGTGPKIADCALLFGAGRLEAFPTDVWMLKTLSALYGLEGWKPEQAAHFARVHFGEAAGLAQQWLFAAARSGLKAPPEPPRSSSRG